MDTIEFVSPELGVAAATLSICTKCSIAAIWLPLKAARPMTGDEEILQLKAKIGELTMVNELLEAKIESLEQTSPFPWRKCKP